MKGDLLIGNAAVQRVFPEVSELGQAGTLLRHRQMAGWMELTGQLSVHNIPSEYLEQKLLEPRCVTVKTFFLFFVVHQ